MTTVLLMTPSEELADRIDYNQSPSGGLSAREEAEREER